MGEQSTLLAEIKLLLQEELKPLQQAVHNIELQFSDLKGKVIDRAEFEKAVGEIRDREDKCLADERAKREVLEHAFYALDKDYASFKSNMKVYIGVAAAVASIATSVIAAVIVAMVT